MTPGSEPEIRASDCGMANAQDPTAVAREVFDIEAAAILGLKQVLDAQFAHAVAEILATSGRVIVSGMGKSGIIANKIAATLASTGTPAFFMHPAEALHGDLGMVTPADVFVAVSNSGETEELVKLIPFLRDNGNAVVAMTGNAQSTLGTQSNLHLSIRVEREACPLQLAPTASTTAALAMGDALAVALMKARGFEEHQFARFHPGGSLGRRLLKRVRDEMKSEQLPFVDPQASADEVLATTTAGKLGISLVSSDRHRVIGVITDGDLRRALQRLREGFFALSAQQLMSPKPVTIGIDSSMNTALELMATHQITALVVVDDDSVVGVVQK
ncbi:KpsF/GutQ family sugar-phosphate isomerase [Lamprobacter modestohalophilus]|uniref:KpsF/GutQ family sugar-phosphate isomerase n=1 Tax=Lamprobacter modestohalophilus TaxID=1064514 RepID=UPI002ADEDAA6|nr:KpsF/GutQ family sugar-phosphate isomerase [Lamprobacter modestohalophilus]MEA1051508.1 KpsF/GutQ family sugar-phosphate isomerase [Lamprobacter modestohalophilus]